MNPELTAALSFYDIMRADHPERSARVSAELYLRRKCPDIDETAAAVALADALATRAAARAPIFPIPNPYPLPKELTE